MSRRRASREPETFEIADLAHDGRGVVTATGKRVFVHGALPGERVRAVRTKRRRGHDEAVTLEVLDASPDRVTAPCDVYGVCGGCSLQHLEPARQVEAKSRVLEENLARIGEVAPDAWLEPLGGPVLGYRRRARLGVRHVDKKERVLVGFRERLKPYVADMERCLVLAPPAGELIAPLAEMVGATSLKRSLPQVEVAVADNRTALVLRVLDTPTADDLAVMDRFGRTHDVDIYLQPGGPDTVRPLHETAPPLVYRLPEFDVELEFKPTDFVQVNGEINRRMVCRTVELLAPAPGERVLDLFCGLGNFTLPLARSGAMAVGVEGDAGLVQQARDNARRNGLDNVEFHVANLFEDCTELPWLRSAYDKVLLDPPRAGALEILPAVAASGARRLVYVSCHPATLARDVGRLVADHGFRLAAAGVMDMFPHTGHVESMAVLERDGKGGV